MSPVTRLARLPGRILLSVHMGNFSLVDQEIQETQPKWCIINLYRPRLCGLPYLTLPIKLIRILLKWNNSRQKFCHFGRYVAKFRPSIAKTAEISVTGPVACFSKVPKLFGRFSGDIILFASSKRRRLEARNFAVIFIFIPFTKCKKISFTE